MSKELEHIKEGLRVFSSQYGPTAIVTATVISINSDDTISVQLDDETQIDEVRLKSVITDAQNKFILVPKVGSVVLIAMIDDSDEYVVIAVEEITDIVTVTGTTEFQQNADGFLMKKGSETLLDIMADLLDAMLQEKHMTNTGVTISLTPDSVTSYQNIKARLQQFLRSS